MSERGASKGVPFSYAYKGDGTMTILINGIDITSYVANKGIRWSRNDIDGENAGRNINGSMIRDYIATKIRLDITCRPMGKEDHTRLMQLIKDEFVTVEYDDPLYGRVSKIMYSNNHSSDLDETDWWENISFPLIER